MLLFALALSIPTFSSSVNISLSYNLNSGSIFGATSQFQTLDQKAATEYVLDVQAEKKMDEEESGDPNEK